MSQTQTALVISEHLGAFKIAQVPIYTPGPGQLLIKIHAVALNPADWKLQKSGQVVTKFPAILGFDRAGEVVEVGEGVLDFRKGDRIATTSGFVENEYQGFQQYGLADAVFSSKLPTHITYDQAATIPICLGTALSGLYSEFPHGIGLPTPFIDEGRKAGLGKAIFIIGGASSVGQFAIQLAKLSGFSTIITTASLTNESFLTSLGATHVIDRSLGIDSLAASLSTIKSSGPEIVFDTIINSSTEQLGFAVLAHFKQSIFVTADPRPTEFSKTQTSVKISNIYAGAKVPWNERLFSTLFSKLYEWLESGDIQPNRVEVLKGGLTSIPEALRRLENNQVSGLKLIARPHETI
ncbi:GroES-like protein [Crepidotus variabilis]|uniref:GroES-like protein n=1 Tax=Crepidotus variabilis TaxID=179855 RepID=A0A9P6EGG5_9AGAR|nr:GroES-like protein [Crepidotus variabilis]